MHCKGRKTDEESANNPNVTGQSKQKGEKCIVCVYINIYIYIYIKEKCIVLKVHLSKKEMPQQLGFGLNMGTYC